MKYIRGEQTYKIDDLPKTKVRVVAAGEGEGPWAAQADDHVVMLNDLVCFYPFRSWGLVLPSTNPSGSLCENIDVTELRGTSPVGVELTIHPEAWDAYIEHGYINDQGEIIAEDDGDGLRGEGPGDGPG